MLIAILILQIVTIVLGILPVALFFAYLFFDLHRESKEKRAAQIAALKNKKKYITYDDVFIINDMGEVGFRLICNLSPDEMRRRKEEIIRNVLKQGELFTWDIELDKIGETPNQCRDLSGFWSYFVKMC